MKKPHSLAEILGIYENQKFQKELQNSWKKGIADLIQKFEIPREDNNIDAVKFLEDHNWTLDPVTGNWKKKYSITKAIAHTVVLSYPMQAMEEAMRCDMEIGGKLDQRSEPDPRREIDYFTHKHSERQGFDPWLKELLAKDTTEAELGQLKLLFAALVKHNGGRLEIPRSAILDVLNEDAEKLMRFEHPNNNNIVFAIGR